MKFLDHLYAIYKDDKQLNIYHMQFIDKIKYIIIHFLFENPTEVINIAELATELQTLNTLTSKFNVTNKGNKDEKVNYLLSLTKIAADDIKEIGGRTAKGGGEGRGRTNKIRKTVNKRKTRNHRRSRL